MKGLITRKVGMTSTIAPDGTVSAVTVLSVNDNVVTQIKNMERDGYNAVQIGAESSQKVAKPQAGHLKASKSRPKLMREFRIKQSDEPPEDLAIGTKLTSEVFSIGDTVHVTAISKGKGWAGTIKRWNFHRGRKTHGGGSYRRPGSIGSMYPQKIFKGKKMAGHMGHNQVTMRNLEVLLVDTERGVIGVKGAVPGPCRGIVLIRGAQS